MGELDRVAAVVGDGWCFRRAVRGLPAVCRHLFLRTHEFFATLRASPNPGVRTALTILLLSAATVTAVTVLIDGLLTGLLARREGGNYDPIGPAAIAWLELALLVSALLTAATAPLLTGLAALLLRHRPSLRRMFVASLYGGMYLQATTTLIVLCAIPLALFGGIRLVYVVYEVINFLAGFRVTLQDPALHVYISFVFLWTVVAFPALGSAPAMYMTGIRPLMIGAAVFLLSLAVPLLVLLLCYGVSVLF